VTDCVDAVKAKEHGDRTACQTNGPVALDIAFESESDGNVP
jgi:hypothetical protein